MAAFDPCPGWYLTHGGTFNNNAFTMAVGSAVTEMLDAEHASNGSTTAVTGSRDQLNRNAHDPGPVQRDGRPGFHDDDRHPTRDPWSKWSEHRGEVDPRWRAALLFHDLLRPGLLQSRARLPSRGASPAPSSCTSDGFVARSAGLFGDRTRLDLVASNAPDAIHRTGSTPTMKSSALGPPALGVFAGERRLGWCKAVIAFQPLPRRSATDRATTGESNHRHEPRRKLSPSHPGTHTPAARSPCTCPPRGHGRPPGRAVRPDSDRAPSRARSDHPAAGFVLLGVGSTLPRPQDHSGTPRTAPVDAPPCPPQPHPAVDPLRNDPRQAMRWIPGYRRTLLAARRRDEEEEGHVSPR
jgi:hypothetical protein